MKPLEVGEIGILQNLNNDKFNGYLATVEKIGGAYDSGADYSVYIYGFNIPPQYKDRRTVGIKKYQIRRISDPDAEQTTEREKEAVKRG